MTHDLSFEPGYDGSVPGRKKKKDGRGGARPGAGRKPIVHDPVRLTFDLEARDYGVLKAFAKREGVSVAEALRRAIQGHLLRLRRPSRQ
jgi:hypothetical protein